MYVYVCMCMRKSARVRMLNNINDNILLIIISKYILFLLHFIKNKNNY